LLIFLPCTLNETKVTVFLLPIGIGAVALLLRREIRLASMLPLVAIGLLLSTGFVFIYDQLYMRGDAGFTRYLTDEELLLDNYNLTGNRAAPHSLRKKERIVGSVKSLRAEAVHVGRLDSFQIPVRTLYDHDPTRLLLGLGVGNVNSTTGRGGAYHSVEEQLGGTGTALAQLLWETGVLGAALFLAFLVMVARDAAVLSRSDDGVGTLGVAWFAITLVVMATLAYNSLFHLNEVACLFIYFSGVVVWHGSRRAANARVTFGGEMR
jgi:hypothetical protein